MPLARPRDPHLADNSRCFSPRPTTATAPQSRFRHVPNAFRNDMPGWTMQQVRSKGSGIVLFHDIQQYTANAVPGIIAQMRAEGYTFTNLDDIQTFPLLNGETLPWVGGNCEGDDDEGQLWAELAALAIARTGDPLGLREARRLVSLGVIHGGKAEHTEAIAEFEHALEIVTHALGPEHVNVASVLTNLANAHVDLDRWLAAWTSSPGQAILRYMTRQVVCWGAVFLLSLGCGTSDGDDEENTATTQAGSSSLSEGPDSTSTTLAGSTGLPSTTTSSTGLLSSSGAASSTGRPPEESSSSGAPPPMSGIFARGEFTIPAGTTVQEFSFNAETEFNPGLLSGRTLLVAVTDLSHPRRDQTVLCPGNHPLDGCATVDYGAFGMTHDNRVSFQGADTPVVIHLYKDRSLQPEPEPLPGGE